MVRAITIESQELAMPIVDGPSKERRTAAGALLSKLMELAAPFVATMPSDPLLPDLDPDDRATAVGRAIGLALAAGRRSMTSGDPADANSFGFLRGLGLGYGEWLRGVDQLSIEVTEECFTDGVARGLVGQVSRRDQPPNQEAGFSELASHAIYAAAEELFVIADHRGLSTEDAARLLIQSLLSLSARFAQQGGFDSSALQTELGHATKRALVV